MCLTLVAESAKPWLALAGYVLRSETDAPVGVSET